MGITVRKPKSRIPVPDHAPILISTSQWTRTIRLKLRDATRMRRARPEGVASAMIFVYYAPTEPMSKEGWQYLKTVSRTNITLDLRESNTSERAWIIARWSNPRGQCGPWSRALSVDLPPRAAEPSAQTTQRVAA